MRISLLLSLMMLAISANAGPGTGDTKLQKVLVESGRVYLFLQNSIANPLSCGAASPK